MHIVNLTVLIKNNKFNKIKIKYLFCLLSDDKVITCTQTKAIQNYLLC